MKWQVRMNSHSGQLYVAEDAEDCATDGGTSYAHLHVRH